MPKSNRTKAMPGSRAPSASSVKLGRLGLAPRDSASAPRQTAPTHTSQPNRSSGVSCASATLLRAVARPQHADAATSMAAAAACDGLCALGRLVPGGGAPGASPRGGAASPLAPAGSCRPRGSPLCTSLRVGRLAAGEHLYEALDATRACVGALGLADAQQHRVAVLACEDVEHRPRGRIGAQRGGQVGGDVDARLARIGLLYPAVLFGALEDGQAGGQHPPFLQQTLDLGNVVLRPRAAGAPWGEALPEGELIEAADLSVDPAVAERLRECLA